MKTPFFSIVIPTKNRSFIIGDAVRSVLRQSFPDFEVVVVDNDDTDATARALQEFEDPRLRHHRTGGLAMADNWETACAQGRGEFLLLLKDKQALHGRTLERLHELAEKNQPSCFKWQADVLDDTTNTTWVEEAGGSGAAQFLTSEQVLRTFLTSTVSDGWRYLPVGHLSAFSRKLRAAILSGPMRRLCPPVSPDYTIGMQALAFGDGVLWVDAALVAISRRHSNGRNCALKNASSRQFMAEIGGESRVWSRTPIHASIIPSSIYNDYLEVQATVGGRLKQFPIDWSNYYVESWRSVIGQDNDGIPMATEMEAFHAALSKEPIEVQQRVWTAIEKREGPPSKSLRKNRVKAFRRRTGLLALEQGWKYFTRRLTGRRHIGKFRRPLDFVMWADENRSREAAKSQVPSP